MRNHGAKQMQEKEGLTPRKRDRVDMFRFRVIPGILATCGLIVSIPSVYQYFFHRNKEINGFAESGHYIVFLSIFGSLGLLLQPNRYLRMLIVPFLLVCGWYSSSLDVYDYPIIFLGILTLWLIQEIRQTNKKWMLLLISVTGMLFLCEQVFLYMDLNIFPDPEFTVTGDGPLFADHADFGRHQLADKRVWLSQCSRNRTVYENIEFVTDAYARRVCNDSPEDAPFHALFCGCSFTFGYGLPSEEILACRIQEMAHGLLRSYNLAIEGSGTASTYIKLAKPEYLEGIRQKAGVCIYNFFPDHFFRNTGHPLRTLTDARRYPLFRINSDGELEGPFHYYQDPYLSDFFRKREICWHLFPLFRLGLRGLVWFPGIEVPFEPEYYVEVTARLIMYSKYAYQSRFTGEFFVVFWPDPFAYSMNDPGYQVTSVNMLKKRLDDLKIKYLVLPDMEGDPDVWTLPYDRHPTGYMNEWIAEHIWPGIKEYIDLLWLYHRPEGY